MINIREVFVKKQIMYVQRNAPKLRTLLLAVLVSLLFLVLPMTVHLSTDRLPFPLPALSKSIIDSLLPSYSDQAFAEVSFSTVNQLWAAPLAAEIDSDGDTITNTIDIDDDNDGILDVTERANWESKVSTATLQILNYTYSTGAINVTRTYTSPTGGGSAGVLLSTLMDAGRILAVDATYLYVLSPTGTIDRYTASNGALQTGYLTTTLTGGESGGETIASLAAANRILGINGTTMYVLSDNSGKIELYTLPTSATTAYTYSRIAAATTTSGAGSMSGTTFATLAAQGRILGMSGTAANATYAYVLATSGAIERYIIDSGAYSAIAGASTLSGGSHEW